MKTPFLGGAYQSLSSVLAGERCINLRVETTESRGGKEVAGFYRTEGLRRLVSLPTGPVRGDPIQIGGFLYVVAGNAAYAVDKNWTYTAVGMLVGRTGPVTLKKNNNGQLLIVDGHQAYGYDTRAQGTTDAATITIISGDTFQTNTKIAGGGQSGANLNIDGLTAGVEVLAGSQFTVPGVFEFGGSALRTFTVLANVTASGGGTATLNITPAIVLSGANQNVTEAPPDNAAVQFKTTAGSPVVNGSNQTGATLATRGWTAKTIIPAGLVFTIKGLFVPNTATLRQFTVQTTVVASGGGEATIAITPSILLDSTVSTFGRIDLPFTGAGPAVATFQDGFFLINQMGTQNWWQSDLNDVYAWSGLNFSSADSQPDNINGMAEFNRQQWLFGPSTIEVWVNGGLSGFAFQRLQGVLIEQGLQAPYSVAISNEAIFWLGHSDRGAGSVWMAQGYSAQRVSTHGVEWAWQQYATIDDARAYTYEIVGHLFYVITFPTGNATWCYDASTGYWHELAEWSNGQWTRHASSGHVYFNGVHVVGDYRNGNLYALDPGCYTDNEQPRRWLRTWQAHPTGKTPTGRYKYSRLMVDGQMGVGLAAGQGDNPQVILRYSDDGGQTWSFSRFADQGKIGETKRTLVWRRLGASRTRNVNRLFEISATDPVFESLIGADMEGAALRG